MVEAGLVDYAAMDIKNARAKYASTCGLDKLDIGKIEQSAAFLMEGRIPYDSAPRSCASCTAFPTSKPSAAGWTARAPTICKAMSIRRMCSSRLFAYGKAELETFRRLLAPRFGIVGIRGV